MYIDRLFVVNLHKSSAETISNPNSKYPTFKKKNKISMVVLLQVNLNLDLVTTRFDFAVQQNKTRKLLHISA